MIRDMHAPSRPVVTAMRQPLLPVAAFRGKSLSAPEKTHVVTNRGQPPIAVGEKPLRAQTQAGYSGSDSQCPDDPTPNSCAWGKCPTTRWVLVAELVPEKFTC